MAELVLAETILLMRGIPERNAMAHRGGWVKTATGSHEVRGKCWASSAMATSAPRWACWPKPFGMRVIYYDIETKLALGNARPMPSLDALLEIADVVTLHVPETPQTHGMIGAGATGADEGRGHG